MSKFNVFWVDGNEYYVSNTLTKSVIKLDERYYSILQLGDISRMPELTEDIQQLKQEGILVYEKKMK